MAGGIWKGQRLPALFQLKYKSVSNRQWPADRPEVQVRNTSNWFIVQIRESNIGACLAYHQTASIKLNENV